MQTDRRRVQTAVTGAPHSADPAYMPTELDDAEAFRAQALAEETTYWCGTLLGGCGGRLSLKVIRERVPHFAHRADSNLCARMAHGGATLGNDSADHLYAHRHLRQWLNQKQGPAPGAAEYVGVAPGSPCTEVVIPLTDTRSLRVVLTSDLDPDLMEIARSPIARDYVWLIRSNEALAGRLFQHGVPYRRVRLVSEDEHERALEVDLPDATGETVWTPLSQCVLRDDTLHRATAPTSPAPSPRRRGPDAAPQVDPDPLEQAIRGLRHVMAEGEGRGTVLNMAETVRRQRRAAHTRGSLTRDLAVEAHAVLEEASKVTKVTGQLPPDEPVRRRVPVRVVSLAQRDQERLRQQRRSRQIAQQVDQLVGTLTWAMDNRRSHAYEDNRAQLVVVLNRPETPPEIVDQVKAHLRKFPADLFTPASKSRTEQGPHRGRRKRADQGKRRQVPEPAPPPPRPRPESLEVQATMDARSRQILEQMRASERRPTPQVPPPERW